MLRVIFELGDLGYEVPLIARESRGEIRILASRDHYTPAGIAALNALAEGLLEGGQWFQAWEGEIISMDTPELDDKACHLDKPSTT
jgi:hypothetical protein